MQVGDLVALSAYGKKLKLYEKRDCKVGILTKTGAFTCHVLWSSGDLDKLVDRRDIKIAKNVV